MSEIKKSKELELKALVKKLSNIKGRGTELISLYIPKGHPMGKVRKEISQEMGTAQNIQSKETRKSVIAALRTISEELKLYKETPENGMAVFCGDIGGVSKRDIKIWVVEPPIPLEIKKYRCDKEFLVEPLKELVAPSKAYGVIVIDNRNATIGLILGKKVLVKRELESDIPGKFRAGGQCISPDSVVAQEKGFKKIKDLEVGEKVLSYEQKGNKIVNSEVTDKWKREKETYKIITKAPRKILFCSPDHKVFVISKEGEIKEKVTRDLKKGDRLLTIERIPHKPQKTQLKDDVFSWCSIDKGGKALIKEKRREKGLTQKRLGKNTGVSQTFVSHLEREKYTKHPLKKVKKVVKGLGIKYKNFGKYIENYLDLKIPEELTPRLARLVGYFIGDGSLGRWRIGFYEERKEVVLHYKNLAEELFQTKCKVVYREDKNYYRLRVEGKPIVNFFKKNFRKEGLNKILKNKRTIANFLRGFFDADGSVSTSSHRVSITNSNKELIKASQLLLMKLGITSSLDLNREFSGPYNSNKEHTLEVSEKESLIEFKKLINFTASDKKKNLEEVINKKSNVNRTRQLPTLGNKVLKIMKEYGENTNSFSSISTNFYRGEKMMSKLKYKENILDNVGGRLKEDLFQFYNSLLTPTKIKEIEKLGSKKLIDISVNKGNFIADGLLVHNSAARFKRRRRKMTLRFYRRTEDAAKREFKKVDNIKGLIIGGPGPTKEKFLQKVDFPERKIIKVVSTNYTGKPGLKEALHKSEDVLKKEEIVKERKEMEEFLKKMKKKPKFVITDKDELMKAIKFGAVDKLYLSEKMPTKEIKEIAKKAEDQGSEVILISDETDEGSQFQELGGYGAILRFPI